MTNFAVGLVVALKTPHNTFLRAESGGGAKVNTQTYTGAFERFIIEPVAGEDGVFGLKTCHGTYLRAEPGQYAKVDTQTYVGSYEKFKIEPVAGESGIYGLRTAHGTFLRVEPGQYAKVNTQTYVGSYEKFTIQLVPTETIQVGSSETNTKVVTLPKPHMIVVPTPSNHQDPSWKDTFDVLVIGRTLYVTRLDENIGWNQDLVLKAVKKDPKWTHDIHVGASSTNSKKIKLPVINMHVSPYPVNDQDSTCADTFKVDVDGEWATVTRLDSDLGWEQDLYLYAREIPNWSTDVDIVAGPDDSHIFFDGERVKFKLAVLPQNHYPTAITQILCYIGPKGGQKQVFELYNRTPGKSPKAFMKDIEYDVPMFPENLPKHDGFVLEMGYFWDMQYSFSDAEKRFRATETAYVLEYFPVAVPQGRKDSFKCDLLEKLPTQAIANEAISLDISYRNQDHYETAISQMFIYFKDEDGGVDIVKLMNSTPGADPETLRGGLSYIVPDMVGKKIEVGAFFELQYSFEDAVEIFKKGGMNGSKVFGSFTIISPSSKDAPKVRREIQQGPNNINTNNPHLQACIENDSQTAYYEAVKKVGHAAALLLAEEGLKYGARREVARQASLATLNGVGRLVAKGSSQAIRRGAIVGMSTFGREAAGGFALGAGAVKVGKLSNPVMLVTLVGEFSGEGLGGAIGHAIGDEKGEAIGSNIGGFAGAVAFGAAAGSVVPGLGTAAGAAAGAVSWGIGKAVDGLFSLF